MPLLRRLHDERASAQDVKALITNGHGRILSDVIADCGFSHFGKHVFPEALACGKGSLPTTAPYLGVADLTPISR